MQIDKLLNEKGALTEERKQPSDEQKKLAAQIEELARMKEAAEFDPLTDNETPEGRATNRRVEIIFLPKIDALTGFDKVLSK